MRIKQRLADILNEKKRIEKRNTESLILAGVIGGIGGGALSYLWWQSLDPGRPAKPGPNEGALLAGAHGL